MAWLKWSGNKTACEEAARAYAMVRPRPKPVKVKRHKKSRKRNKRLQPSPPPQGISYGEYLLSEWWAFVRRRKLSQTRGRCERCPEKAVLVHHKHYKTLRREQNSDLESLCKQCHDIEHEGIIQAENHLRSISREVG